jgi:hypothetical protein
MLRALRSCFGKLATLVLLVVAAYAGWVWGPVVFPRIQEWLGWTTSEQADETEASPEVADSVLARVQAFRRGEIGNRLALNGQELTSVMRYSVPGLIPEGVSEPGVRLDEGRIHVRAEVVLGAFPELPDLGPILGILPDTLTVEMEASLMPFEPGQAALLVEKVEAGRIPLPRRLIPEILKAMGRVDRPGLPPEAITVPLPPGLGSVYILADSLVISTGS